MSSMSVFEYIALDRKGVKFMLDPEANERIATLVQQRQSRAIAASET